MLEKNNPPDMTKPNHKIYWIKVTVIALIVFTIIELFYFIPILYDKKTNSRSVSTFPNSEYEELTSENLMKRVDHLLFGLPEFSEINCPAILAGDENEIQKAKGWKIQGSSIVWDQIEISDDKCKTFKQSFVFLDRNLTFEEAEYPLAYGALVYKDIEQVTYMLSALYRPNNVFVFMVDKKASNDFKERIQLFSKCFPNICVKLTENPVEWGGYEVTRTVFDAVQILTESKYEWKYFQYISGFTLPLKTNLEMVRIFKALNGTPNIEISKFPNDRLTAKQKSAADSPLSLFKSSLSGTFSRETAEAMVNAIKVKKLMEFLEDTDYSDESLWGTIVGNPDALSIPGSFNATEVLAKLENNDQNPYGDPNQTRPNNYTFVPSNYYISRYQIWEGNGSPKYCQGKFVSSSCVFGVGDLPMLITRPELVAHKFYFDFEPAAYFCLYQNHWKRTLNLKTQQKFNATPYSNLALVQANRGIPINNITFFYYMSM